MNHRLNEIMACFILCTIFLSVWFPKAAVGQNCGDILVPGSEYGGVDVYSNGLETGGGNGCTTDGPYGIRYQCVELARRFWIQMGLAAELGSGEKPYGEDTPGLLPPSYGAYQIWTLWNGAARPSGSAIPPAWGDLLVWDESYFGYGHVAVVTGVQDGLVHYVQQNCSSARGSVTIDENNVLGDTSIYGWKQPPQGIRLNWPNGGDTWVMGNEVEISWRAAPVVGNILIHLYKGGTEPDDMLRIIENDVPSASGSYTWTVPCDLDEGTDYKIGIAKDPDGDPYDFSDDFFQIVPGLEIAYPNGAEVWLKGMQYPISWDTCGYLVDCPNVSLYLYKDGTAPHQMCKVIKPNIPNSGEYQWVVDADLPTGNFYYIGISDSSDDNPWDFSDDPFSILGGAQYFTLRWPLIGDPSARIVLLAFGADWPFGECPPGTSKIHVGVDTSATAGEGVYASAGGIVRAVVDSGDGDYLVTLEHTGFTTLCWHVDPLVAIGKEVAKGQKIATVANMGANTHLHFGIRNAGYSSTSNLRALPGSSCNGDPAFPEGFIDPLLLTYEEFPVRPAWQMERCDARASACSHYVGPSTPAIAWEFALDSDGKEVVIAVDGTIFCPNGSGVSALTPEGGELWYQPLPANPNLALTNDGSRLLAEYRIGWQGFLRCLEVASGDVQWSTAFPSKSNRGVSVPIVSNEGFLFINAADDLYCLEVASGTTLWATHPDDYFVLSRPLLDDEYNQILTYGAERYYSTTYYRVLACYDFSGTRRWITSSSGGSAALDTAGNFYRGRSWFSGIVYGGLLASIDPNGIGRWYHSGVYVGSRLGITADSSVVFGENPGASNRTEKWTSNGLGVWSVSPSYQWPTIDAAGNIYAVARESPGIVSLTGSGELRWSFPLPANPQGSLAIDDRGCIYCLANSALYCIEQGVDDFFPLKAPWTGGQSWVAGGDGSFYNEDRHVGNLAYAVDFNYGDGWDDFGQPILAAAGGKVNRCGYDADGYGNYVKIDHGAGYETLYAHLQWIDVDHDRPVYQGKLVGPCGNSGYSTGPHLHFELRKDGVTVPPDPMDGQAMLDGANILSSNLNYTPIGPPALLSAAMNMVPGDEQPTLMASGALNSGIAKQYSYGVSSFVRSTIILNWSGSSLGIEIIDPDGITVESVQGSSPPLAVVVERPKDGTWTIDVVPVEIPCEDYGFGLVCSAAFPVTSVTNWREY